MKRHIPFWQKIFAKQILIKFLYIKYTKQSYCTMIKSNFKKMGKRVKQPFYKGDTDRKLIT